MIEIKSFDSAFLDIDEGGVKSFEFVDPDKTEPTNNIYCVGVQWVDGDPESPENWRYDHTNYWSLDTDPNYDAPPRVLQIEELEAVLKRHQTSFRELLTQFIKLAYTNQKERYESQYGSLNKAFLLFLPKIVFI